MESHCAIYKKKGETPLQALDRLRSLKPEYANVPMSYAGRLDPLAEGVMMVLIGEECKEKEKFTGLDKTYNTEILIGISTDTADVLGKVTEVNFEYLKLDKEKIVEKLQKGISTFSQKYPIYSSKNFAGSYESVREGKDNRMIHEVTLHLAEFLESNTISSAELLQRIEEDIAKVSGDFRQEEIIERWRKVLSRSAQELHVLRVRLGVSSGFYVRQFAEDFGRQLGRPALALSIVRESVGDWKIVDCI